MKFMVFCLYGGDVCAILSVLVDKLKGYGEDSKMKKLIKQDMPISGKSYNGLDLFKFIMAIFVVILHAQPMSDISYNVNYALSYGLTRLAVPFFFVASGFLLYRKMDLDSLNVAKIRQYLRHIIRLYAIWTVIYLPIVVYSMLKSDKNIWREVLVFMRNTIVSGSYFQLWFLQALVVVAIIVSALIYFRISAKRIFIVTGFLYAVALLGMGYYWIFDYFFPEGSMGYSLFHLLKKVFVTPRNGIFFAPIFFFMGAYFSRCNVVVKNVKSIILGLFVGLMLEVMLGSFYGFNGKSDVYIFLVPLTFYVFCYARNLRLPDSPIWIYLRKQSMYIFYIHAWFLSLAGIFLGNGKYAVANIGTLGRFLVVILLSFIFGHIIIKLSQKEKFSFLKYLS